MLQKLHFEKIFSQRSPFTVVRITPAYAGKTANGDFSSAACQDQPFRRLPYLYEDGQNKKVALQNNFFSQRNPFAAARITPAYAGKIEHSGALTLVALVRGYRRVLVPNMKTVFLPGDRHKKFSLCFYHQEHLRNGLLFCAWIFFL